MIPADIIQALTTFDEDALALLANKGLVKRAQRDVEDGKIAVTGFDGQLVSVSADGETVRIDARGPRAASCTCPAPGTCRHRLAATIVIQNTPVGKAQAGDAPAPELEIKTLDFAAELQGYTPDMIAKWAGKAAWRAALDLAGDTEIQVTLSASALLVHFGPDKGKVRILGGQGLNGIVSKIAPALQKTYHATAMIVARQHFGLEAPILANEEATPEDTDVATPTDPEFLAAVAHALHECANVALNIAPVSLEERLFSLAVSSRADALPRLGAMLRALSKLVRSRRNREFNFEADACLALMADAYAVLRALTDAPAKLDPDKQAHLRGKVRQDYLPVGDLDLIGCGADRWRMAGGARGVTGHFYDPSSDRWYSGAVARAAGQDPLFEPAQAYRSEALWGAGSLEKLSKTNFVLKDASATAGGRLSMAQGVQAKLNLSAHARDPSAWPCYQSDWAALLERFETRFMGGLATPRVVSEPVILAPARLAKPQFDELSQSLTWAIEDSERRWLSLSLPHDGDRGTAMITALESMIQAGWSGAIVALASVEGSAYALRPFAVWHESTIFSLGLDALPQSKKPALLGFGRRILGDLAQQLTRLPTQFTHYPKSTTQMLLASSWQVLVEAAEIGLGVGRDKSRADLARHSHMLTDAGLTSVGEAMSRIYHESKPSPVDFFKAAYLVQLAQHQLTSLPLVRPIA
jgi:hypothetical protein